MKNRFVLQLFLLGCAVLVSALLYGQIFEKNEVVLLEELKEYIQAERPDFEEELNGDVKFEYTPRMLEVIKELIEIGSPNIVQFFLENIRWRRQPATSIFDRTKIIDYSKNFPIVEALLNIHEVPLRMCIDAYVDALTSGATGIANARAINYVAKKIHGENFQREIDKLAEVSPDPEQWKIMRQQLDASSPMTSQNQAIESATKPSHLNIGPSIETPAEEHTPAISSEESSPPVIADGTNGATQTRVWVCVGIVVFLCLGIALYMMRKKP